MSRVPIHDHTNIHQGGKLRGAAISGIGIITESGGSGGVEVGGGGSTTGDFLTTTDGAGDVISTVSAAGATETIDLVDGNVHDITLTANCTFTFATVDNTKARSFTMFLRQDGTGGWLATWPGSVVWNGGVAPTLSTDPNAVDVFAFVTLDGGIIWYGFALGGGGSSVGELDDLTDVTITAPTEGDVLRYVSGEWINDPDTSGGGEDTTYQDHGNVGATETIDCTDERVHHVRLDANCTITLAGAVAAESHRVRLVLQQDNIGSHTVTWPASVLWPAGSAPTLSTGINRTDIVDLISINSGTEWLGVLVGADYHTASTGGGVGYWPMLALTSS